MNDKRVQADHRFILNKWASSTVAGEEGIFTIDATRGPSDYVVGVVECRFTRKGRLKVTVHTAWSYDDANDPERNQRLAERAAERVDKRRT